ncbi:uncharacterized protein BT62DRAFT_630110 [Guyanagaster necrorhizus]|uniref:Uncharacterized protein n=1 Tax=Guyanagaster necrorhizus TaxID=856835 RepID=A0A9P8ALZ9_9AGAR|nr:uncharacterized protein BT62DRAFT_630110 [Guyanagaster necrorhizus MCA 3950]KAG7440345.1 hypothetical protein BT62DRAFT_630110 [Guyanagaster necrorhizus MCA 3950]
MFSWRCSRIPLSRSRTKSLGSIKEESGSLEDELSSESNEDDGAIESDGNDFSAPAQRSSSQMTSWCDDFSDALQYLLEMEEKRHSGFCTSMIRQPSTEHSFLRSFPQNILPTATPSMDRNYSFSAVSPASHIYFSPGSEGNTKRPREDALEDIRSPKRIQSCRSRCSTITDETTPTFRGWKRSRSERKDHDMPSPRKKARPTHRSYSVSQPASLRRAQSLRADTLLSSSSSGSSGSTSSTYTRIITPTGTFHIPHLGNSPPDPGWIPTAPSSPEPVPVQRNNYVHLPPELFLPSRFGVTRPLLLPHQNRRKREGRDMPHETESLLR